MLIEGEDEFRRLGTLCDASHWHAPGRDGTNRGLCRGRMVVVWQVALLAIKLDSPAILVCGYEIAFSRRSSKSKRAHLL